MLRMETYTLLRIFTLSILCLFIQAYGTAHDHCTKDKEALCGEKSAFSTETKTNCLQEQIQKVTNKGCKKMLEGNRGNWIKKKKSFESVLASCKADSESHCSSDKGTRKNLTVCLMMNSEKISKPCKAAFNTHVKAHLQGIKTLD